MKKAIVIIALIAIFLTGCATVNAPALIGDGTIGTKTGYSTGRLIFGIGNVDAGMITAARSAGITRIGTVDFEVRRVLGFVVVNYTATVTGQ